jgi:peptidoglycan/LPS O-acetylase OafA/YrhL
MAWPLAVPAFLAAALITGAIVHLSWRCVEEPFLALGKRRAAAWTSSSGQVERAAAPTASSRGPVLVEAAGE